MMTSRRRREGGQNLDSLLDTMANVVGILVVVLAFTQLHIGEAVRRIHTGEVESARRTDDALLRAGQDAHAEALRLAHDLADARAGAGEIRREVAALSRETDHLHNRDDHGLHDRAQVVAAIVREFHDADVEYAKLAALRARREQLEVRMREAEHVQARSVHQIRLPDPRPAPRDTQERVFFCRYGRIVLVDFDELYDQLNAGLRSAGASPHSSGFGAALWIDHFQRLDVGNAAFRWRLSDRAGVGVAARLAFRDPAIGDAREDLLDPDSAFQRALDAVAPGTHYLRFHVWSDSFASYLLAREVAEARGFSVGWRAYDRAAEHEGILQTNVPREATPID